MDVKWMCLGLLSLHCAAAGAERIPLYPADPTPAPPYEETTADGRHVSRVITPTLEPFLPPPERASGTAVVICPGGGYGFLAHGHEGAGVAQWFNERGVAAFVLRYRIGSRMTETNKAELILGDVQRAVRLVRARAAEWKLKPDRIGLMGFSAGGHLAAIGSTRFLPGVPDAADPVERVSSRPDFSILVYPVISFIEEFGHKGTRKNMLGDNVAPERATAFSPEAQVARDTPPAFLFQALDDRTVPWRNAALYAENLAAAGVPCRLCLYRTGGHGKGINAAPPDDFAQWKSDLEGLLRSRGLLDRAP